MNDIEIIIKIPEKVKNRLAFGLTSLKDTQVMSQALKNGIVLSKGHGRIIDENEINKCEQIGLIIKDGNTKRFLLTDAPTIIEADNKK